MEMLSLKSRMLLRLMFGIIVLVVAYVIAKEDGFLDALMVEIYIPIIPILTGTLVTGLFFYGIFLVIQPLNDLLWGCVGEPNYKYDGENRCIFVRYTSSDFKLTRDGTTVCFRMFLVSSFFSRPLHVYETSGLSVTPFDEIISGTRGSDKFVTSDSQVLHFKRHLTGIMISWEEVDKPWRVVN